MCIVASKLGITPKWRVVCFVSQRSLGVKRCPLCIGHNFTPFPAPKLLYPLAGISLAFFERRVLVLSARERTKWFRNSRIFTAGHVPMLFVSHLKRNALGGQIGKYNLTQKGKKFHLKCTCILVCSAIITMLKAVVQTTKNLFAIEAKKKNNPRHVIIKIGENPLKNFVTQCVGVC